MCSRRVPWRRLFVRDKILVSTTLAAPAAGAAAADAGAAPRLAGGELAGRRCGRVCRPRGRTSNTHARFADRGFEPAIGARSLLI